MPISQEFKGKNVEKAIEAASEALEIAPEKIKYEVVTYGSSGIFGLVGVKKAVIKVLLEIEKTVKPKTESKINNFNDISIDEDIPIKEEKDEDKENIDQEDDILDFGKQALEEIVHEISENATVSVRKIKERVYFSINGGDSGVLIGKRGQTLEAIQYIIEKIINKKTNKRVRIMVDVEGYLEKRKTNLKKLATRMAEKAKKIKKPVTIGQMNAHERRIVHIHLKDERGIRTQSIGEGYYRKLMIFPKKHGSSKARNSNTKI